MTLCPAAVPPALRRCLTDLVDNAIRYGGRPAIRLQDSAERLTIRVLDDGPGVLEGVLEQAFLISRPGIRPGAFRAR
jgi:signal transduction histidine kinase